MSQNQAQLGSGLFSVQLGGNACCQFGTPPIAAKMEMGTVVSELLAAMSGMSSCGVVREGCVKRRGTARGERGLYAPLRRP